ncbi:MAG: hypothetical protein D6744_15115, partial [Planctomycetota bacterium]
MTQEVLIAGFGGQGILLAGQVLADAAMRQGYYATWFPSYGPEMRGGTANCTTIYADVEIGSPIASSYDTIIVMNQPSLEKFAPKVGQFANPAVLKRELAPLQDLYREKGYYLVEIDVEQVPVPDGKNQVDVVYTV